MAKTFKPGIPDNFKFDVAPVADLGDYLDERGPSPIVAKRGREPVAPREETKPVAPTPPPPVVKVPVVPMQPAVVANADVQRVPGVPVAAPAAAPVASPANVETQRAPRHTGPRREINMTPEALRMSDELLDLFRGGSGQSDTKANELMHALVLLAYEVKDELDPYSVPKRGRWGSPTARAYPLEIKNAILRAITKRYSGAAG